MASSIPLLDFMYSTALFTALSPSDPRIRWKLDRRSAPGPFKNIFFNYFCADSIYSILKMPQRDKITLLENSGWHCLQKQQN